MSASAPCAPLALPWMLQVAVVPVMSMSAEVSVPVAEASVSSLTRSAALLTVPLITGASLVPVMVKVTFCVPELTVPSLTWIV